MLLGTFLYLVSFFELSTILYDKLMTSFCLQKIKDVFKVDYVSKGKPTPKKFSSVECLSKHHINS